MRVDVLGRPLVHRRERAVRVGAAAVVLEQQVLRHRRSPGVVGPRLSRPFTSERSRHAVLDIESLVEVTDPRAGGPRTTDTPAGGNDAAPARGVTPRTCRGAVERLEQRRPGKAPALATTGRRPCPMDWVRTDVAGAGTRRPPWALHTLPGGPRGGTVARLGRGDPRSKAAGADATGARGVEVCSAGAAARASLGGAR